MAQREDYRLGKDHYMSPALTMIMARLGERLSYDMGESPVGSGDIWIRKSNEWYPEAWISTRGDMIMLYCWDGPKSQVHLSDPELINKIEHTLKRWFHDE